MNRYGRSRTSVSGLFPHRNEDSFDRATIGEVVSLGWIAGTTT
ncbi:hypothetical protein [Brucella intermedia]|nr:hypothetical protein [Brucella intermedia]